VEPFSLPEAVAALRSWFDASTRIWVSVHESPDGDSIGSAMALASVLSGRGKHAVAIRQPPFPAAYEQLPLAKYLVDVADLGGLSTPDLIIAVDVGSFSRVGRVQDFVRPDTRVVNIDHHAGNRGPEQACRLLNLVDPEVASTTMLTYLLLRDVYPGCIGPQEATCLYLGLITDTGCFRHSNTDARALRVAAELAELGADSASLPEQFMFRRRPQALRLLGEVLSSIEFHGDGIFATMILTADMLRRTGARSDETEGFVNYASSLEGVHAAALLRELDAGATRLSLRSSGHLDVARLARGFDGGGHRNAAGATLKQDLAMARRTLVAAALQQLEQTRVTTGGA
jgi:phosphoesterase RecJ-like protein